MQRKSQFAETQTMKRFATALIVFVLAAGILIAQRGFRGGYGGRGFRRSHYEEYRTPREITQHGNETPTWTNAPGFEKDVFTFVRIKRDSRGYGGYGGYGRNGGPWWTDAPDSDLNLAYRLQQMTALKVDPDGRFLRLT